MNRIEMVNRVLNARGLRLFFSSIEESSDGRIVMTENDGTLHKTKKVSGALRIAKRISKQFARELYNG